MAVLRALVERYLPITVAVAAAVVSWKLCWSIKPFYAKELLSAGLSAAAISAGFMTTALSILLPLGSTRIGRRLHRRGKLPDLMAYIRHAIYGCLLVAALCVLGFFFVSEQSGIDRAFTSVLVFSSVYAAAALGRVLEILIVIFHQMAEPEDHDG